jgi:HPt (histidine-containing phosphotransfer) domain-containing protein
MRCCGRTLRQGPFGALCFTGPHAIRTATQSIFCLSAEPPLDENVLDGLHRLSRDGRPDLAKIVIMLFLETAPTTLQDLQRGAATNDRELIARTSHILSASGAAVGAVSLAARCRELEAISRTGAVADAAARVQLI